MSSVFMTSQYNNMINYYILFQIITGNIVNVLGYPSEWKCCTLSLHTPCKHWIASTENQDGSELEVSSWWKLFRVFEGASQGSGGEKSCPTGQPVNLPDKIFLPMWSWHGYYEEQPNPFSDWTWDPLHRRKLIPGTINLVKKLWQGRSWALEENLLFCFVDKLTCCQTAF